MKLSVVLSIIIFVGLAAGLGYLITRPDKSSSTVNRSTTPATSQASSDLQPQIVDETVGSGAEATSGKTLKVHYVGKLANGTQFDANLAPTEPFSFTLGGGEVIKGWDEGLVGMKVGGKRRLTIPPALGYGDAGAPPKIPAGATLTFEIELVSVQ